MTATATTPERARTAALTRPAAMELAATEYRRFIELLESLRPADWKRPTDCSEWDVHAMAAHALGMAEMAASIREQRRQVKAATKRGGTHIDALTALQVEERIHLGPAELIARLRRTAPKAVRGRRLTPALIRRLTFPQRQTVGGREETWTIGFLVDVILTRDPWMHRVDIVRATGGIHDLTADHDGVLVDDIAREWAHRHGRPLKK